MVVVIFGLQSKWLDFVDVCIVADNDVWLITNVTNDYWTFSDLLEQIG